MNTALREELLAPFLEQKEFGGIRYFRDLPLGVLEELIDHGFVEMDGWNECPGVAAAFLPFLRNHPEFTAHGYAVSWDRPDVRISIEGLEKTGPVTNKEVIDFANTFRWSDEMEVSADYARCWYD